VPLPVLIESARAMGRFGYRQEMQRVTGGVRLNGKPAPVGTPVNYGDTVETGKPGMAIFILGKAVFLVRDNTRLILPARPDETLKAKAGQVIKLTHGKVLAVLRQSRARFLTPTAVVGIRGTGLYLEAEPARTYACLCYGKARIAAPLAGNIHEDIKTRHHESPRYIYKDPGPDGKVITPAPVINHTDAELILLESLVDRQPPFVGSVGSY
jgi:hypothetical protein